MAKIGKLVNKFGKMAGWNSMTLNVFENDVEGLGELSYDDDTPVEAVYGAGNMPIGVSDDKNYEAKVDLSIYQEEMYNILDKIPPGKRISDMVHIDIPVEYEYNNRTYKDIIRNFKITGFGKSLKQNDGTIMVKVKCFCTHIDWNVRT
jgi:hypothetical protein